MSDAISAERYLGPYGSPEIGALCTTWALALVDRSLFGVEFDLLLAVILPKTRSRPLRLTLVRLDHSQLRGLPYRTAAGITSNARTTTTGPRVTSSARCATPRNDGTYQPLTTYAFYSALGPSQELQDSKERDPAAWCARLRQRRWIGLK